MSQLYFRKANASEAPEIARLVNDAYRPKPGAGGWTSEEEFVTGARASADMVRRLIERDSSVVLLGLHGMKIVCCGHVEAGAAVAHIGMLAVEPTLQQGGVGKELLAYAEAYAASVLGAEHFVLVVLEPREQLIAFYQRRGYQRTGRIIPYPAHAGFGTPIQPALNMVELRKQADCLRGVNDPD